MFLENYDYFKVGVKKQNVNFAINKIKADLNKIKVYDVNERSERL